LINLVVSALVGLLAILAAYDVFRREQRNDRSREEASNEEAKSAHNTLFDFLKHLGNLLQELLNEVRKAISGREHSAVTPTNATHAGAGEGAEPIPDSQYATQGRSSERPSTTGTGQPSASRAAVNGIRRGTVDDSTGTIQEVHSTTNPPKATLSDDQAAPPLGSEGGSADNRTQTQLADPSSRTQEGWPRPAVLDLVRKNLARTPPDQPEPVEDEVLEQQDVAAVSTKGARYSSQDVAAVPTDNHSVNGPNETPRPADTQSPL